MNAEAVIMSAKNEKIKNLRLLASSAKARREADACFIEGLRLCREAFAANRLESLFATAETQAAHPGEAMFSPQNERLYTVSASVAESVSDTPSGQGVFGCCKTEGLLRGSGEITGGAYLLLEEIADPGNMGTLIRSAEAFGASGVIIAGGCDIFSPKVVRASMGGMFRIPVYSCSDPAALYAGLKNKNFRCYATAPGGGTDIQSVQKSGNFAVAIGNEANGLTKELMLAGERVTIPMRGGAESLNAAAAGAIVLWEFFGRTNG